jgi:hypothetical protein
LLVTTDLSSAALQEMAELAYEGGDLFVEFRDHIRRGRPVAFSNDGVPDLALRWRMMFTNTVTLYWWLSRLTGQQSQPWPTDGRNLLLPVDRQAVDVSERQRSKLAAIRPYRSLGTVPAWTDPQGG